MSYFAVRKYIQYRGAYVSERLFDHIYRDGMETVMKSFLQMFRTWITKQEAHFNGTNRQHHGGTSWSRMYVQTVSRQTNQPHT
jgi:hypothetical protein